ncbi:protein ACCELERATED CELL DEATH 6 [Beta vulgaris subsp. vulgaris]|uniref:protein ACCELERATED CELL DEATH 6 n=1 Tax=Beta vulgaris subsp. vulgaris TaxID=3555 RepID=UPI00203765A0|nr:protein ACCELERATED CELL DEATH 6 [Beta vulgaris subsp. vulgaris]
MKGLINLQDSEKNTPLHKAIEKHNIHLTEALLGLEKINYTIENKEGKTAMDMLAEKCNGGDLIIRWDAMCQRIGINPRINTSFFQQRTDLLEVRNSLFVVAALIATITFAAGFTLPGGLNQDNGEAMMATKAAFLVFLMANTLGMCTSTLVLICLIWSLVHDKSSEVPLLLIEKSMYLLMVAICSTLLAFMTGVFVTISPQNLWPTIVVIIMCSLIGILVERNLLQKVLRIRPTKRVMEHQQQRIFWGVSILNACSAFVKKLQFQRKRKNEEREETSSLV